MSFLNKLKNRARSWAVWTTLAALVTFVSKQWIGWEIAGWDEFATLLIALLLAFGILNNPDNRREF